MYGFYNFGYFTLYAFSNKILMKREGNVLERVILPHRIKNIRPTSKGFWINSEKKIKTTSISRKRPIKNCSTFY